MLNEDEVKVCVAERTEHLFSSVTASAAALSAGMADVLSVMADAEHFPRKLPESQLRKTLFPVIEHTLAESRYCFGAGFACHHHLPEDKQPYWFLEWWFKNPRKNQNSCLELDQATQQRLDFSTFEWFKNTRDTENVSLHGPYVDYVCTSAYTLTASSPVMINQKQVGIAAVDVLVSVIEAELLTLLRQCRQKLVIANPDGRVMISSHPRYRTGTLIDGEQQGDTLRRQHFMLFAPY